MKDKPQDISFHYTNEQMVKDLLAITPIRGSVLDAGSGKNKVWFNNLVGEKYECEIEDGNDFLLWDKKVDWVVGNPPYHIGWEFTQRAIQIANKGIAWLVNNMEMNSLMTPRRITIMQQAGFYLNRIQVVADKRWFGRYYYLIFIREDKGFLGATKKTY